MAEEPEFPVSLRHSQFSPTLLWTPDTKGHRVTTNRDEDPRSPIYFKMYFSKVREPQKVMNNKLKKEVLIMLFTRFQL